MSQVQSYSTFDRDWCEWCQISEAFDDIYCETSANNRTEWHININRTNDYGNELKFHFMVLFDSQYPYYQPKVCMLYGQRQMISSKSINGIWVLLDNLKEYTIKNVILNLRLIVNKINIRNADPKLFNSQLCLFCNVNRNNINGLSSSCSSLSIEANDTNVNNDESSTPSIISLTISQPHNNNNNSSNNTTYGSDKSNDISSTVTSEPNVPKTPMKKIIKDKKVRQSTSDNNNNENFFSGTLTTDENGGLKWTQKPQALKPKTKFALNSSNKNWNTTFIPKYKRNFISIAKQLQNE